jgi:hypothetical protein
MMRAGVAPSKHPALSIEIEHALVAALARRRDVSVARLVHDLLNVIATDQLTTAILDDWPPMISLTDEQLRLVMELAAPIPVKQRDEFLRKLTGELRRRGGPGELHRLCVEVRHSIVTWTTALAAGIH